VGDGVGDGVTDGSNRPATPDVDPDVDSAGDPDVDPNPSASDSRSRAARILFNRRVVKGVGILLVIALLYYSFFVLLPSELDWAEVKADFEALTATQIVTLVVAGLIAIVTLGWTSKASLPGLTLYQGTESSATSQLSAFAFPPPADLAIRFAMYRTYGFSDEESGVAVLIAMVLRYVMIVVMPVLGLAAVLVTGQGDSTALWWFLGLGALLVAAIWLLLRVAHSEAAAHATGRVLQRVATWVIHRFRRTPPTDLEQSVVTFGSRIGATVDTNARSLVASNLTWGLSNGLVMGLSLRFSGLTGSEVSTAQVLLTTGLVMAVNMLPIPGKDALIAPWIAGILALTGDTATSDLATALLLYRMMTWILPMPVGGITFFLWRWRVRRDRVTTHVEATADQA
jgi:uncharacterized membrane protein YbhN (UPF0104 family)